MRNGFSILLLCLSFNAMAVNEILYMEKDQFLNKSEKNRIFKKYRHPINSTQSILEVLKIMLNSDKYKFIELNSTQYEDIPRDENNNPINMNFDQFFNSTPWHFTNINAHKAASLIKNPKEVTVAVCDSGYEEYHDDLQGRSIPGFSLIDYSYDTSPNTHHGTMVSGIIVGRKNSITNSSGIAPFVKIMPLRITTKKGSTTLETIVNCIKMATDRGAKVVNVSFTGVNNDSIEAAGAYARERGTLVVYSAGNQGRNRRFWPDHKNVLIVGGIQQGDTRWNCNRWYKLCGSNFGDFVDLVAPARDVFTTRAHVTFGGDTHSAPNGTSFAAPIVSAVAALVYSVNPKFTPSEVENILTSSARKVGSGSEYVYGAGLVDAEAAVRKALSL